MKPLERALLANNDTPGEILHDLSDHPDVEVRRALPYHRNLLPHTRAKMAKDPDHLVRYGTGFVAPHQGKIRETGTALVGHYLDFTNRVAHLQPYQAHGGVDELEDRMAHHVSSTLERHAGAMIKTGGHSPETTRKTMEAAHAWALSAMNPLTVKAAGHHMDRAFHMAHDHSEWYD